LPEPPGERRAAHEPPAQLRTAPACDGLARLLPLGDLAALGGAPARCPRMDADGDYPPARDPAYPPEPEPTAREACAIWHYLHPVVDFSCLYAPGAGWTVWDAWARAPLGDAA